MTNRLVCVRGVYNGKKLPFPVNKRELGLTTYRQKRQRLYQADVHLLELDLLRRGTRPFVHPQLPEVVYAIALTPAHARVMDV